MDQEEAQDPLVKAIVGHGNQLGDNLVFLKNFLAARQVEQQTFMAELQAAGDRTQRRATNAAIFSAVAALFAAVAAGTQAYVAWQAAKHPPVAVIGPAFTDEQMRMLERAGSAKPVARRQ